MPTPEKGEKKQDYINRCVKYVIEKEGAKPDHARAKCEGMWNQHQKNKNKKKSEAGNMIQNVLNEQFWYMDPNTLQNFMTRIHNIDFKEESFNPELIGIFDIDDDDEKKKPFKMENDLAIIEIHGSLVKKASGLMAWFFGVTGMAQIGETFNKAVLDTDVKGIFLDVDSPGGSSDGTSDLADIIFEARGKKPVLAFADGQATSAAAWISSSADFVAVANEMTRLGSIGVYGVHLDIADMAKEIGIRPTVFSAGKFKAIGNQFEHLSGADKKYIQSQFDYLHGLFIQAIVKNTGISENKLNKNLKEAQIFMGSQGIAVGLAHKIMNRQQAMALLSDVADGKTSFEKHKTKMESIKFQGGENNMDTELKIKELETKLEAAQTLITEMTTSNQTTELNKEIAGLKAEKESFKIKLAETETATEALKAEIETMKTTLSGDLVFVTAGKAYIDNMKADIKKTSVQVDGDAYNEVLVDRQLEAFGNDVEMLSQFKTSLETRRSAMIKTGEIIPDPSKDTKPNEKTEQEQYELGANLVPKNIRLVQ